MKKTKIFDFFQLPSQSNNVPCPACGTLLLKSKLNEHLDSSCSSSILSSISIVNLNERTKVKGGEASKSSVKRQRRASNKAVSTRLSLKKQRNVKSIKTCVKLSQEKESDDDIVILEEKLVSPNKANNEKTYINSNKQDACNNSAIQNEAHATSSNNMKCKQLISGSEITREKNKTFCSKAIESNNFELKVIEKRVPEISAQGDYDVPAKKLKSYNEELTSGAISKSLNQKLVTVCTETTNCKLKVTENEISETKGEGIHPQSDLSIEKQELIVRNVVTDSKLTNESDAINDMKIVLEDDAVFSEELSDTNEKDEKQSSQKNYIPYYIANFKHILLTVLNEEDNQVLFNEEDMKSIAAFKAASDAAQKLYVRLFQRKYKWLRINKINYPDITQDPLFTLEELVKIGLVDSGSSEIDLETAIELLSLPEAKNLAKHFNFNSAKNKTEIKEMLLKHCKQHKSVFFMNGRNGISNMMLKKVKQVMGPCYRISLLPKRVFTRVLMLFSLPTMSDDEEEAAGGQQQQLITLLQVNKGELVFPNYKINKKTVIFCDRDELIRYEEARQLENDIFNAIESKNFELAKELYINAREEYEDQCSSSFAKRASSLPLFLKRYTSFHVYIRCMTLGVEALQRLRQYKEAVSLLRKLLKQTTFCQDYKGRWYDRLALNLEQHLKQPEQALEAIKSALSNNNVRAGHRYSLLTRALRITKSLEDTDEFRQQILKESSVIEAPKHLRFSVPS
ncbi:unnamed protein product [Larinioides sclopetarius]|uniref:Fanconi-associated nuclease n=1 Tax=Larinioides sclopetarius TaxID=280406 RepID=A0AAV1YT80_9ARAC